MRGHPKVTPDTCFICHLSSPSGAPLLAVMGRDISQETTPLIGGKGSQSEHRWLLFIWANYVTQVMASAAKAYLKGICVCVCLSVCLSVCLCLCVCVHTSVCFYISVCCHVWSSINNFMLVCVCVCVLLQSVGLPQSKEKWHQDSAQQRRQGRPGANQVRECNLCHTSLF